MYYKFLYVKIYKVIKHVNNILNNLNTLIRAYLYKRV